MRLATIHYEGREQAALIADSGLVPLGVVNEREGTDWDTELWPLLQAGGLDALRSWYDGGGARRLAALPGLAEHKVTYGPLYRRPGKMIGIGMNYLAKAIELSGRPPEDEPVVFLKPDTSLIGPGAYIEWPAGIGQVTAEAELAIVIGRRCRSVGYAEALDYAAGYASSLDMTAKDVHARNPRFMQRSKSYDTFTALGASLVTPDEYADLNALEVVTRLNGEPAHRGTVGQMIFSPAYLISFLSGIMTLNPGDVILTGTPGSVVIAPGDVAECSIFKQVSLRNPVR
ncbi:MULTISPECIES: fumarylacetoacetate hydrolase family protein [Saccharibacillus]|uniref:fumarylacetoacetate hydrolase family protein n=1 Tax=Saccharibacillus TaxID=456492 RepID=UPI001238CA31|nr:fumarylacetoacetate hydrolase [Saccharibacillus sp. WB 17]